MADEHDTGNLEPPRLLGGRRKPRAAKPAEPRKPARVRTPKIPAQAAAPREEPTVPGWAEPEPTQTLPPVDPAVTPESPASPVSPVSPVATAEPAAEAPARARRRFPRPSGLRAPSGLRRPGQIDGRVAAAVAGLVAGFVLVGGVVLGLQGCQAVQGTDSCGTGPGLGLLVVIFVVAVLVGRFLLGLFAQPDPGSTSFLSVGLTSVLALLFLTSVIGSWPMIIVIPVLTAVTMVGSWLVTTRFIGSADA